MASTDIHNRKRGFPRLFVKYWWQLLLALGAPLGIAVAVGAWFGYRAELAQIKRTQALEALALATAVQASLQKEIGYMSRLYATTWPESGPARLAQELETALGIFPVILQVQVFHADRQRLFVSQLEPTRTPAMPAPVPMASPGPRLSRSKPQLSLGQLGPQQVPVILVAIQSDRYESERLVMAIDLRAISDLLAQASRRESSRIYLLDGEGRIIAHSEPALSLSRQDLSRLAHVALAKSQPAETAAGTAVESEDLAGTPVLATMKSVAETDWLLVIERPLDQVIAPIRRETWRTMVLLATGLIGAALLGLLLARRFTRPILRLGSDVERIGRGDLSHRTQIRTDDEIEQLGRQVNDMAASLEDYTAGLERKVAERTSELEAAMRARALFLAAASHDLRQPLYAISILADTLAAEPLDAGSAEILGKQREAIAVLRTLFDNLLDLSRFDAGEVKPVLQVVALRELLGPVVLEAEVVCHSKGLHFDCVIDDVGVETDPILMRRAVANLLSNAARYTPSGDVRLTAQAEGQDVVITITDTGIGIAPEDQQRVFEEFVQLANPARDRDRGVGLGLSIVRRICSLLHVELDMASKPNVGTTFTLRFHIASLPAQEPSIPVRATELPGLAGCRVWIVEDDLLVRDALGRQFGAWGSRCSFANGADEIRALREAEGSWPDVILMDDMLGSAEGGLEIANWLREHMPSDRILLVTGNVGQRLRALEESGLAVFRKPLSSTDLARGVQRAMSSVDR